MIRYLRNRELNKLRKNIKSATFGGLKNAKNVLVLYRNEISEKTSAVLAIEKMLEKYNLNLVVFGFANKKLKKDENPQMGFYYRNNLNWKGIPEREIVKNLTRTDYDVIIDLDQEKESPNIFILLSATAGLKVGICSKPDYDLVVEKANFNENTLVEEMEKFLIMISKK